MNRSSIKKKYHQTPSLWYNHLEKVAFKASINQKEREISIMSKKVRKPQAKQRAPKTQAVSQGSNAMVIWLAVGFAVVIGLVGYLVWDAAQEGKSTREPATQQTTPTDTGTNNNATPPSTETPTERPDTNEIADKPKVKRPISDQANPVKKLVDGLPTYDFAPPLKIDTTKNYQAIIKTNKGDMKMNLFANEAPLTVNNFIFLARDKYYDNIKFHRIVQDFMIQTGDPKGDGTGGPGYKFADELGLDYDYIEGVVAMANSGPNTNGSQFFIGSGPSITNLEDMPNYSIFGQIIEGMDVVKSIAATPVTDSPSGEKSKPLEDVIIKTIEIVEP
jgi:cyclophilin family peptidyl-prolyl cis-trans isomerase